MAIKLQHGDSLYQVIEKVNELIDGKVQPGSGGSGGSSSGGSAAINGVQDMVYAEIDRAQAAEQYLQEQIDAIVIPESGNNSGATLDIGSIQPALIIESLRAATAEQFNSASLSAEVARAQAAEQTLQTEISNEVTRATTAEQANATAISNEVTRATAAEQANATAISNEITRATAAEQNLQDQINSISGALDGTKQTWSYAGQVPLGVHVACFRRYGNVLICLSGAIAPRTAGGEGTYTITTIPAQYRPPTDIHIYFTGTLNSPQGEDTGYKITIATTGVVTLYIYSTRATAMIGSVNYEYISFPAWD